MITELMDSVEQQHLKSKIPSFNVGDTVDVSVQIVEGEKKRIQIFSGVVIARKGRGTNSNFTVRRIINNEGVERIFPLHSPSIVDVKVKRSGVIRRSKLYFLRDRTGKAVRLREKWTSKSK